MPGMFLAYHVLTKPYTAKNEASGIVGCLLGLFAETVQNLFVISAAPTTWPPVMMGMATYAGVATLNLEALGLACVGSIGNIGVVGRYFCQTLVFPSMVGNLVFGILHWLDQLGWSCWCSFRASLTVGSNKVVAARLFDKTDKNGISLQIGIRDFRHGYIIIINHRSMQFTPTCTNLFQLPPTNPLHVFAK